MATMMHEYNNLHNNDQFMRMYVYFLINQQHSGPMTNVEEILYDPRINTNAGNEIVREMFRDLDVEMILRNVVRGNGERMR